MSLLNNPRFLTDKGRRLGATAALLFGIVLPSTLALLPAGAVRLRDGRTFFNNPPRLIRSAASFKGNNIPGTTYQFTLKVPEDAGEPLEAIKIVQQPNVDTVRFNPGQTRAFRGNSFAGGPSLSLANIGGAESAQGEEIVVFNPPVAPGNTVTVSLKGRSPDQGGVYLFGVTAFPAGAQGQGQFLGYGRLHFYTD